MNTALQQTDALDAAVMLALPQLKEGEANAGLIMLPDGKPSHWLILLPGDKDNGNWQDATDWTAEQGGELPTRNEQSLLFANAKDQFKKDWYWSGVTVEGEAEWAWYQYFSNGHQDDVRKSVIICRARAVRRVSVI